MGSSRRVLIRVTHSFLIAALAFSLVPSFPADDVQAASRVTTYGTFDTELPFIALTFDVTFDRGDGPMILDILADRNVRATFALTGRWAQDNPDLVRRMVNEGHFLMNHTWDHPSFTGEYTGSINFPQQDPVPSQEIIRQLQTTENLIRQQVGVDLRHLVAAGAEVGFDVPEEWLEITQKSLSVDHRTLVEGSG
jgi:peptidoglycan-N-acetylglucosamine deacetylase